MDNARFNQQIAFLLELDKLKNIYRQTLVLHEDRAENDAEHSFHLAMMACILAEHANTPVDVLHTMKMVLVHDVVEIDAGDTYAYDAKGLATQKERESKAADRIFGLLPNDQKEHLIALFEELEEGKTPEARFAKTMDNLQPILLNDCNNGKDWRLHEVNKTQVLNRQKSSQLGSEEIWTFTQELIEKNVDKGNIKDE